MVIKQVRSGFTLIEILIAMAIVGMLIGIAGPALFNYLKSARLQTTKSNCRSISSAIDAYYLQIGKYPETLQDLVKQPADPEVAKNWPGAFLEVKGVKEVPKDAWDRPFVYRLTPGAEKEYELYSKGPEGKSKVC